MKLPVEKNVRHAKTKPQSPKWLVALCIVTLFVSLVAAGLSLVALSSIPAQVDSYAQAHKEELKGDKGDKGDSGAMGPRGFSGANGVNGSNSYAPTHCSTYGFGDYASTNCY